MKFSAQAFLLGNVVWLRVGFTSSKMFFHQIMLSFHFCNFSFRNETVRIDWGAYPHYNAPEVFAPFILDGRHLYYINAFENAASTMETSAVAAENIARLILSRFFGQPPFSLNLESFASTEALRVDLWAVFATVETENWNLYS